MPYNIRNQPIFIRSGDPETENEAALQYPGMLGGRMTIKQPGPPGAAGAEDYRFKTYQLIQVDSSAAVGPYKGAVAWWSDKTRYLVTTTATNRNRVAGVFQNTIGLGNYGFVQVQGPASVKFLDADMASVAIGEACIPSATNAKATRVAVGTAPTHTVLGWIAGPPLSTTPAEALVVVDLDVPETP